MNQPTLVALAWYAQGDWSAWAKITGGSRLDPPTWENWLRHAEREVQAHERLGRRVIKVPVTPVELAFWCQERSRKVDSRAVAEYAADRVAAGYRGEGEK